jgi:hypothetical protein
VALAICHAWRGAGADRLADAAQAAAESRTARPAKTASAHQLSVTSPRTSQRPTSWAKVTGARKAPL